MSPSGSLSELIIGGEAHVTRRAVNNGTINIGVVGFIEQVVNVSLYGEIFRHLIAGKQIDQRIAALFGAESAIRSSGLFVNPILSVHAAADGQFRHHRQTIAGE